MDDQTKPSQERWEVLFSGRVQGVGFRYTTRNIAERFAVTGFVRNLPDGRVELIAEGEPAVVEQFVVSVAAELRRHIDDRQVARQPATGEFDHFTVAH